MTTSTSTSTPAGDRAQRFLAEVGELKQDSGDQDVRMSRVGWGLMLLGGVLAVLALLL